VEVISTRLTRFHVSVVRNRVNVTMRAKVEAPVNSQSLSHRAKPS
jgi:hypothetical protein